jgi:hypothetical protein
VAGVHSGQPTWSVNGSKNVEASELLGQNQRPGVMLQLAGLWLIAKAAKIRGPFGGRDGLFPSDLTGPWDAGIKLGFRFGVLVLSTDLPAWGAPGLSLLCPKCFASRYGGCR